VVDSLDNQFLEEQFCHEGARILGFLRFYAGPWLLDVGYFGESLGGTFLVVLGVDFLGECWWIQFWFRDPQGDLSHVWVLVPPGVGSLGLLSDWAGPSVGTSLCSCGKEILALGLTSRR
jgi:hypothetical protein